MGQSNRINWAPYQPRGNKYHARKTMLDGIVFDSKKEAERYAYLNMLQKAGRIRDLRRQVEYELFPKHDGLRAIKYYADFVYTEADTGRIVVEDAKGVRTPEYKLKKRIMLERFNIEIHEV